MRANEKEQKKVSRTLKRLSKTNPFLMSREEMTERMPHQNAALVSPIFLY